MMKNIFRFRYIFYCFFLVLTGWGIISSSSYLWVKWQFKRDYRAAELGNLAAQNRVGLAYSAGKVVTQNDALAGHWFRKAAEQGYPNSQHSLALRYDDGRGVEQDYQQAIASGLGKSHLAAAITESLIIQGHRARFYSVRVHLGRGTSVFQTNNF